MASYGSGHFVAWKAGMSEGDGKSGRSKLEVLKIVEKASEGSKFYANAQEREAENDKRIQQAVSKLAKFSLQERKGMDFSMRKVNTKLSSGRPLHRIYCVVDMDMFYAAVHQLADPSLKEIPFAVGSIGMLSTANYLARGYGVRSAMPGFIAKQLCPALKIVKSDFALYTAAAEKARAVFARFDPLYSSWSLDEAVLDITDICRSRGIFAMRKPESAGEAGEQSRKGSLSSSSCSSGTASEVETEEIGEAAAMEGADGKMSGKKRQRDAVHAAAGSYHPPLKDRQSALSHYLPPVEASSSLFLRIAAGDSAGGGRSGSSTPARLARGPAEERSGSGQRVAAGAETGEAEEAPAAQPTSSTAFFHEEQLTAIAAVVQEMRKAVEEATGGLTCSCGIAPSRVLAKMLSNDNKPNGQAMLQPWSEHGALHYLCKMSVRRLPGVGKVTERELSIAFGVQSCLQMWQRMGDARLFYGEKRADYLVRHSLGLDSNLDGEGPPPALQRGAGGDAGGAAAAAAGGAGGAAGGEAADDSSATLLPSAALAKPSVHPAAPSIAAGAAAGAAILADTSSASTGDIWSAAGQGEEGEVGRKSISKERTFRDCNDEAELLSLSQRLATDVAAEMQEKGIVGSTVSVKLKLHDFSVRQRSHTLHKPSNEGAVLAAAAAALLRAEFPVQLRLLGVRVSSLLPAPNGNQIERFLRKKEKTQLPGGAAAGAESSEEEVEVLREEIGPAAKAAAAAAAAAESKKSGAGRSGVLSMLQQHAKKSSAAPYAAARGHVGQEIREEDIEEDVEDDDDDEEEVVLLADGGGRDRSKAEVRHRGGQKGQKEGLLASMFSRQAERKQQGQQDHRVRVSSSSFSLAHKKDTAPTGLSAWWQRGRQRGGRATSASIGGGGEETVQQLAGLAEEAAQEPEAIVIADSDASEDEESW